MHLCSFGSPWSENDSIKFLQRHSIIKHTHTRTVWNIYDILLTNIQIWYIVKHHSNIILKTINKKYQKHNKTISVLKPIFVSIYSLWPYYNCALQMAINHMQRVKGSKVIHHFLLADRPITSTTWERIVPRVVQIQVIKRHCLCKRLFLKNKVSS